MTVSSAGLTSTEINSRLTLEILLINLKEKSEELITVDEKKLQDKENLSEQVQNLYDQIMLIMQSHSESYSDTGESKWEEKLNEFRR